MHGKPGWPRPMYSKEIKRAMGGRLGDRKSRGHSQATLALLAFSEDSAKNHSRTITHVISVFLLGSVGNQNHAKIKHFCTFWVHPPQDAIERPRAPQNDARTGASQGVPGLHSRAPAPPGLHFRVPAVLARLELNFQTAAENAIKQDS